MIPAQQSIITVFVCLDICVPESRALLTYMLQCNAADTTKIPHTSRRVASVRRAARHAVFPCCRPDHTAGKHRQIVFSATSSDTESIHHGGTRQTLTPAAAVLEHRRLRLRRDQLRLLTLVL